jgi:hypothetical protein
MHDMSMFLAFDPAVSLHYEVFFLPRPEKQKEIHAGDMESKDKVISISVFSSQTGQWASREFVPGCCAPTHLYDMVTAPHKGYVKIWKTAEYWQGSLYVHCWNDIIMIIHNSEGVYDMAQLPSKAYDDSEYGCISKLPKRTILASYEKGVHYVALDRFQLHVWTLAQSDDGKVRWVLAHEADLSPYNNSRIDKLIEPKVMWEAVENNKAMVSLFKPRLNIEKIINDLRRKARVNTTIDVAVDDDDDDEDDNDENGDEYDDDEFKSEEGSICYWNSDEDNYIDLREMKFKSYGIVGLHPHKDVVFLATNNGIVAYHFRTSKIQYLGQYLVRNRYQLVHGINAGFPYRPCYVDALPATKLPYRHY